MGLTVEFGNKITFTLTDNFMDTIIEDKSNSNHPKMIVLNNLAVCSLAERGVEFCTVLAAQQNNMLPLDSPIFNLKAEFYNDKQLTIKLIQNQYTIITSWFMFKEYYEKVLCNIIKNENMQSAVEFEKPYEEELKSKKEKGEI